MDAFGERSGEDGYQWCSSGFAPSISVGKSCGNFFHLIDV